VVEGLQLIGGRRRAAQRIEQLAAQARIIRGSIEEDTRRILALTVADRARMMEIV